MYPFSPIALQQLHDAGWTEDRRVDISDYEQKMRELGIDLFPCVREFFARFGNLRFRRRESAHKGIPTDKWVLGRAWLETTLWLPTKWGVEDWQQLDKRVGRPVQRIGVHDPFYDWPDDVFMAANGMVYVEVRWCETIGLVGISAEDGIEALLSDRPAIQSYGEPVPEPDDLTEPERWREYVERTRIVPPDEVIALLIPEAQDAIQRAAASLPHHGNDA